MQTSGMLKWLHRIGYATTLIVAIELLGIGGVVVRQWQIERQRSAAGVERTRTHYGRLRIAEPRVFRPDEMDLLAALPPLAGRGDGGFRFVAIPSFGRRWYAYSVSLPSSAAQAHGMILVFDNPAGDNARQGPRKSLGFTMSRATATRLMAALDNLTRGWKGEGGDSGLDGTLVAFERVERGHVSSGSGNSSCSDHYKLLSQIALAPIKSLFRHGDSPATSDWMPKTGI